MIELKLFLGILLDDALSKALDKANPEKVKLFIQEGPSQYLQEIIYQEATYLGKSLSCITKFTDLALLEEHIFSLVKKLVPDYPYSNSVFVLFPISLNSDS